MSKGQFRPLPVMAGVLSILFFLLGPLSIGAQDIGGLETLGRIDTEHFSIYFPPTLEDQAKRLSGFADSVLADLASLLGSSLPERRFPILLSDVEISLNGYFSPHPSNRIVIYLAGASESLDSLGDVLREVFLHELFHALTMNRRGPFWSLVAAIAGDTLTPSSWVAPDSFIEGAAVWAESRNGKAGRLNDPAALETIYQDLAAGRQRGLWEVSGLADFPGSGNLPYYYGALFSDFVEKTFGEGSVARLWKECSRGDPFSGFEGSLLGGGAVERALGKPGQAVWADFLVWLSEGAERRDAGAVDRSRTLDLDTKRVGPFALGPGVLYYYDAERKAVFSSDLEGKAKKWLFDADSRLEAFRLSEDGSSLLLDWSRQEIDGKTRAIACNFDLASGKLSILGSRSPAQADLALSNLVRGGALQLQSAQYADPSGWIYGLAPMGSVLLPARVSKTGEAFLMDVEGITFRSISRGPGTADPVILTAVKPQGLSRLAVLESSGDSWILGIQKDAPPGGARDALLSDGQAFYRGSPGEGASEIRSLRLDEASLAVEFSFLSGTWLPVESWRKEKGEPADQASPEHPAISSGKYLFPELLRSARWPWADGEAVGIEALGTDLTSRLSWTALAGWDYLGNVPEEALTIDLASGNQAFGLSLSDRAAKSSLTSRTVRRSTAVLRHSMSVDFLPNRYSLSLGEIIWGSGMDEDYSLAEFASPSYSYLSTGGRLNLGWSTMGYRIFPPHDLEGFSVRAGVDYEIILGRARGWSASVSMTAAPFRPDFSLSLYGTFSPDASVAFLPGGRYLFQGSNLLASSLSPPYPVFKEYARVSSSSPWYLAGELQAPLLDLELWNRLKPLRLPDLPSVGLRRIVARGGLRAAAFEIEESSVSKIAAPLAVFLRAETDAAFLAGIGGLAHISLMGEVSYALTSALAGGGDLHYDFSMGVSY